MFLSIIIPLYNEEDHITRVVEKLRNLTFPEFVDGWEVIIVDDRSSDASLSVAEKLSNEAKNIRVESHLENMGKGAAVQTGISKARGNVFLIQDADLELDPEDIPRMLIAMKDLNIELINGSRYLAGVARPLASYKRYLANKFFTQLTSILIDVHLTDMACGYKLIHKNLYDKIELKEKRFGFEAELLVKALRIKKNNIAEIPVKYFPRNEGQGKKLRNTDAFKILFTIVKYGVFYKKNK